MKVVLFAGGFGTRLSEETSVRPKPMVEIGGRPLIWHIMSYYAHFGFRDFVILGGYKVGFIRDYFLNFRGHHADFQIDLASGETKWLNNPIEDWKVTVLDTGIETMTGGRLRRAQHLLRGERFLLTYGDGLSNVDLHRLIATHDASKAWCTLTAVMQPGRYGALKLSRDVNQVTGFREKGASDGGLINGGFFVCEPEVFEFIDGDDTVFEDTPMARLIKHGKLASYRHDGYWQSMDSLRDKHVIEQQWAAGAPWKVWPDPQR
ncbi:MULTISPECIES: glucose-1-phosphate cytidylyltransferase [Methylobacterium]|jgi:glucose-1-phosphate cytidylyltransferase|uniref:Glucose-1-phosphate cytidylyltransferase n=1 Tax=Methylobacterium longum TaxID=767694 RepID=A0ABT8AIQ2_9HYPH|nr:MULTISPECIES: glucose-1-phosphate cytidylyltransferase [Methylobacterium]MCJ2099454.1 glucose-1-phosphate cytidylyltransferase [Methylobacterium sp. E-046]MDN3569640.1 glucose-1-phosphate cytidylyltransferase [Methylobacterium longum]GJE13890.1 Glucose-1-phosphate cytidylyltransferase [Methylobacterium longum]